MRAFSINFHRIVAGSCLMLATAHGSKGTDLMPTVIPPSPEVAALGKFGEVPVNNYTGVSGISILIYTIQTGDLTVPITLSYHAAGVAVKEEATWVGLGWTLQAGGVLSRSIVGSDDLTDNGLLHNTFLPDPPRNPAPHYEVVPFTDGGMLMMDRQGTPANYSDLLGRYDWSPDLFSFQAPGLGGKFIIHWDSRRGEKSFQPIDQQKVLIEYDDEFIGQRPYPVGTFPWRVTSADGTRYYYGTRPSSLQSTAQGSTFPLAIDAIYSNRLKNISSWFLDRIESARGNRIEFAYERIQDAIVMPVPDYTRSLIEGTTAFCYPSGEYEAERPTQSYHLYEPVYLSRIAFPGGYIEFERSAGERMDLVGAGRLVAVRIYQFEGNAGRQELIRTFRLYNDSYFVSEASPAASFYEDFLEELPADLAPAMRRANRHRLKLDSLVEYDQDDRRIRSHAFSYVEKAAGVALPEKTSFRVDHWGYFNNRPNTGLVPELFIDNMSIRYGQITGGPVELKTAAWGPAYYEGADRRADPRYSVLGMLREIRYPTGGSTVFHFEPNSWRQPVEDRRRRSATLEKRAAMIHGGEQILSGDIHPNTGAFELVNLVNDSVYLFVEAHFSVACQDGLCSTVEDRTALFRVKIYRHDQLIHTLMPAVDPFNQDPSSIGQSLKEVIALPVGSYRLAYSVEPMLQDHTFLKVQLRWNDVHGMIEETNYGGGHRLREIQDVDPHRDLVSVSSYEYRGGRLIAPLVYNYMRFCRVLISSGGLNNWVGDISDETHTLMEFPYIIRSSSVIYPLSNGGGGIPVGYDTVVVRAGPQGRYGKSIFIYHNQPDLMPNQLRGDMHFMPGKPPSFPDLRNGNLLQQHDFRSDSGGFTLVRRLEYEYALPNFYHGTTQRIGWGFFAERETGSEHAAWFVHRYPVNSLWNYRKRSTETLYFDGGREQIIRTDFRYEDSPRHYQLLAEERHLPGGEVLETRYRYPADAGSGAPEPMWNDAHSDYRHMHNMPVSTEVFSRREGAALRISASKTEYRYAGGRVLPYIEHLAPGGGELEPRLIYSRYDARGNLLEVIRTAGDGMPELPVAFLWGYSGTLPVAGIEGAPYDQVVESLGGTWNDSSQGLSALQEQRLRQDARLERALISTFQYEPLRGLIRQSDANGLSTRYEYDAGGRLHLVRDAEGQIVRQFNYRYFDQPNP
jgi:YD repeat-containing protein